MIVYELLEAIPKQDQLRLQQVQQVQDDNSLC